MELGRPSVLWPIPSSTQSYRVTRRIRKLASPREYSPPNSQRSQDNKEHRKQPYSHERIKQLSRPITRENNDSNKQIKVMLVT